MATSHPNNDAPILSSMADDALMNLTLMPSAKPANSYGDTATVYHSAYEDHGEQTDEMPSQDQLAFYRSKAIQQDIQIFEMRALLQSGKGLSNILNLKQLLETFMSVVREKYGVTQSAVLLKDDLDPTREFFRVKAYYGLSEFYHDSDSDYDEPLYMFKFPKNNGLLWQIVQQGNVFSVRDMQGEPRFAGAWQSWHLDCLQSDVWCPLIKSGEVLGILTLGPTEDGSSISPADYAFLQELASIATTNIDSTLKYEKNERILKNIQTLYDINQQIANVNDFKRLCFKTLSTAVEALGAQKGNLMILNKETQKLEIRVVWGDMPAHVRDDINSGLRETKSYNMGEGVAGQCALTRKPIRVNDRTQIPQVSQHEVYCIASVPIVFGQELEGVINMTNKVTLSEDGEKVLDPLGRFTEEDMALLLGLADQAAVNLHKTRLYNASITDKLTSLYNTRYFEQMYHEMFHETQANGKPMVLAILDIDHFKKFNDVNGHAVGDEVLRHVAKILNTARRADGDDMVFRYGGEEFCVLMPNTRLSEANDVVESIRERIETTPLELPDGRSLNVTVSIGVASTMLDADNPKSLFECADDTLYSCKENGRNQVRYYLQGAKFPYNERMIAELVRGPAA